MSTTPAKDDEIWGTTRFCRRERARGWRHRRQAKVQEVNVKSDQSEDRPTVSTNRRSSSFVSSV
ncbi:MAG: hypothetical protein NZ876_14460, partial [Dehalococcoidia bacterium]|nr:hypothetical protein [Dehalococcoidia bacterium]